MQGDRAALHAPLSGLLAERKDLLWGMLWLGGLALTWVWLGLYLNAPAPCHRLGDRTLPPLP